MKIDDFLDRHVEGYLFKDLDAMSAISLKPGEAYGAVGYPMVSTALAGIELLGGLVSPQVFNANNGATYFRNFWRVHTTAEIQTESFYATRSTSSRDMASHMFLSRSHESVSRS